MDAKCRVRDSGTHKVNDTCFLTWIPFVWDWTLFNNNFVFQVKFKESQRLNEGYKCVSSQRWSLNMD